MTQAEIFDKGIKEDIIEFGSISGIDRKTPEEIERLTNIADCYNNSMDLINLYNFNDSQKEAFLNIAKQEYFNKCKLLFIASCVQHLYKNNDLYTKEKLDMLLSEKTDEKRMSQMYIAIVKDLTLEEMQEISTATTEEIVEKTKETYRKHYNIESLDDVIKNAAKDNFSNFSSNDFEEISER